MEVTEQAKPAVPETAEKFIHDVRRKTRRKFTAKEKIRIVLEGMQREMPVTELCRREGIPSPVYYGWAKEFMEAGKARLKRDMLRDASKGDVEQRRGLENLGGNGLKCQQESVPSRLNRYIQCNWILSQNGCRTATR